MKIKSIVTVSLIAFILASCAPAIKVVPTKTAVPTGTPFHSTPTITPTNTPTSNPTATIALPVQAGTSIPVMSEKISVQNLGQLTLLSERPADGWDLRDLVVSPDNRLLGAYVGNKSIYITAIDSGATVWSQKTGDVRVQRPISFSPDGTKIQVACSIYYTKDFSLIHEFTKGPYLMNSCDNLVFFPDGTKVALGLPAEKFYEAYIWTVDGSQLLQTITFYVDGESFAGQQYTLSPDGSLLLVKSWVSLTSSTLWLFNISDGKLIKKFPYRPKDRLGIWNLNWSFSPDGTLLAIDITQADQYNNVKYLTEMPHTLEIWRLADMTRVQNLEGMGELCGLTFSPDGTMVAERSYNGITFRNTNDWSVINQFEISGCTSVTFSPDGKLLITGAQQGIENSTIQIYGIKP